MGGTATTGRAIAWAAALALACAVGDGDDGELLSGSGPVSAGTGTGMSTTAASVGTDSSDTAPADSSATADDADGSSTAAVEDTDCAPITWYGDMDGDGRGAPDDTTLACDPPAGYVPFGDDCDDADPLRNPSAIELCDAVDNDCDGLIDEVSDSNTACNGCDLFEHAGHSYALCPAGASEGGARTACAAFGGDLLRLEDEAELAVVIGFPAPVAAVPGGWSIGLSDVASEGTFVWVDGGPLTFTSWNAGEPNDAAANEDCAEMDLASGGWNDIPCVGPRAFVCEAPLL